MSTEKWFLTDDLHWLVKLILTLIKNFVIDSARDDIPDIYMVGVLALHDFCISTFRKKLHKSDLL